MKYGLNPSPDDRPKLHFHNYVDVNGIQVPDNFGHYSEVEDWGMLANDRFGCCAWASGAHEVMVQNAANNRHVTFTDDNVLSDYAAGTGFNPGDPSTDRGTNMLDLYRYRQTTGIVDAQGNRHKIGGWLELEPGNPDELAAAVYLFGVAGIGITVYDWAERQFATGQPWSFRRGGNLLGGHAVPIVGRQGGNWLTVTWGKLQVVTQPFFEKETTTVFVALTEDYLTAEKSPEGLDRQALINDLPLLQRIK